MKEERGKSQNGIQQGKKKTLIALQMNSRTTLKEKH
jgi:hypothetical protein